MKKPGSWLRGILSIVLLVFLVALAGGWIWLRQSLPQLEGEVSVKGLSGVVEIVRDPEGIPHLFAKSERDGWFAMGYVHAQDRLWQMEFQRRVSSGRLAEILGERAFDTDRLMRTLGFARLAERIVRKLDAGTLAGLEAYSAGVNAFLASDPALPPEFGVFRIKPEAWKPADTVGWLMVMAWDLSGNWRSELNRLRFSERLGRERANEILPPYPGDPAIALPDFKALYADVAPMAAPLLALSPGAEEAVGSNSWAVDGTRSETGKALLANDPHLGLQAPALWYLVHIATPGGNLVGGTLPGVPFVVLGRNDRLAWSMTTTNGDTQDLYIERVVAGDGAMYLTPLGPAPFEVREEVIVVDGQARAVKIRATRHGPVISDAIKSVGTAAPAGHVIALAWAALTEDNATARAGFALNRATTREQFLAALRDSHAPQQTYVFADDTGHIGMVAPALVPVRHPDNEAQGRVPVPGWEAKYDWQGMLDFADMPALHDPKSGQIATANNKITPAGYKPFMTTDWMPPYRADRIEALLSGQAKHSVASFRKMQADARSRLAVEMLPAIAGANPGTEGGRQAKALLAGWQGDMAVDQAAPLVFSAWFRELSRLVQVDEMGALFADTWEIRAVFMIGVMRGDANLAAWCDNVKTPAKESCQDMAGQAFDLAAEDLARRYGPASGWRWGRAHFAASVHRPLGLAPYVGRLFNVQPETAGDTYSVNVGHFAIRDEQDPFANRHAPSLRAIYDFSDLDRSLFMHSTGQSGHFLSPWYANFAERWARVDYLAIPTKREALAGARTLTLKPAN